MGRHEKGRTRSCSARLEQFCCPSRPELDYDSFDDREASKARGLTGRQSRLCFRPAGWIYQTNIDLHHDGFETNFPESSRAPDRGLAFHCSSRGPKRDCCHSESFNIHCRPLSKYDPMYPDLDGGHRPQKGYTLSDPRSRCCKVRPESRCNFLNSRLCGLGGSRYVDFIEYKKIITLLIFVLGPLILASFLNPWALPKSSDIFKGMKIFSITSASGTYDYYIWGRCIVSPQSFSNDGMSCTAKSFSLKQVFSLLAGFIPGLSNLALKWPTDTDTDLPQGVGLVLDRALVFTRLAWCALIFAMFWNLLLFFPDIGVYCRNLIFNCAYWCRSRESSRLPRSGVRFSFGYDDLLLVRYAVRRKTEIHDQPGKDQKYIAQEETAMAKLVTSDCSAVRGWCVMWAFMFVFACVVCITKTRTELGPLRSAQGAANGYSVKLDNDSYGYIVFAMVWLGFNCFASLLERCCLNGRSGRIRRCWPLCCMDSPFFSREAVHEERGRRSQLPPDGKKDPDAYTRLRGTAPCCPYLGIYTEPGKYPSPLRYCLAPCLCVLHPCIKKSGIDRCCGV